MTITRPFYAGRVLGSPDVPVSVREDSGRFVIDSGRAPQVEGSVSLAVPDAALLDDLDPRDARRLVVDVYPTSHLEPIYSAWLEQARNAWKHPGDGAAGTTGWVTYRTNVSNPGGYTRGVVNAAAGSGASGLVGNPVSANMTPAAPGDVWSASAELRAAGSTLNIALGIQYFNASAVFIAGSQSLGSTAAASPADWRPYSVTSAPAPAGTAYFRLIAVRMGASIIGDSIDLRRATAVRSSVPPSPISGNMPAPDALTRYRFIGVVNASASVLETRTITGWQQVPDGTARTFDLGIREATPSRGEGTVQVQLASDEAVLDDFAQLVDDKGARAHETSLRGVVDYVLDKIGASLEPGTDDADVTAYWQITNLLSNPSFEVNATGWLPGTGASPITRVNSTAAVGSWSGRWTASAGASNVVPGTTSSSFYTVKAGEWYVFAFSLATGAVGGRQARAAIQWWSQGGSFPSSTSEGPLTLSVPAGFNRMWVIAQCPPGADRAVPFVNTIGNTGGEAHYVDAAMFYAGDEIVPYFDGATADSATYEYQWQADAHASTSTRVPEVDRPPAAFTWRAGVSGLAFLVPLFQAAGFRLLCNERREWTLRNADYREDGTQAFREGVNIVNASEQLSRSSEEWFDGAVYSYTWTDDDGIEQTRDDAFSLPGATKVIRREIRAPYPGPGRAEYAVGRAQGRGRTITASRQPDWTETADQTFSALLEGTGIQVGTANRVEFDLGGNTVTTTSRTTEIPFGAIDLLPGTINALTGTINNL